MLQPGFASMYCFSASRLNPCSSSSRLQATSPKSPKSASTTTAIVLATNIRSLVLVHIPSGRKADGQPAAALQAFTPLQVELGEQPAREPQPGTAMHHVLVHVLEQPSCGPRDAQRQNPRAPQRNAADIGDDGDRAIQRVSGFTEAVFIRRADR